MDVWIARAGVEIGAYRQQDLDDLARAGQLEPTDHYWHNGMEDWALLGSFLGAEAWEPKEQEQEPNGPLPKPNYITILVAIAALVVAFALAVFLLVRSDHGKPVEISAPSTLPDIATAAQVRDKAAADLQQKVDRLPSRAVPPLNAYYYDVRVDMNKRFSSRAPWSAIIRGRENIIDPQSENTISQLSFILTAEYQDGEWVYRHYRASASDMAAETTTEMEDDESSPTPPSIVAVLGLKSHGKDSVQPTPLKVPQR